MEDKIFNQGMAMFTSVLAGIELTKEKLKIFRLLLNDLPDFYFYEAIIHICQKNIQIYPTTNIVALIREITDQMIEKGIQKNHPSPKALIAGRVEGQQLECPDCYGSGLVQRKEIKMGIPYQISYACPCPLGLKWQKTNFWTTLKKYSRGDLKYSNNPFELLKNAEQIIGKKRFYCARALTGEGKQDYICQNTCEDSRLAWCLGNIAGIKEQLNPA